MESSHGNEFLQTNVSNVKPREDAPVKWGSVTHAIGYRPTTWREIKHRVRIDDRDPNPHDVMLCRIAEINRHTRIELDSGRKAKLYPGDVVGVAFGNRYATRQYHGTVPTSQPIYDMLSQGGVCGEVVSAPRSMREPTLLRPLGFLHDDSGEVVNLHRYGIKPVKLTNRVPVIVVVGSSMDAGKTTMASGIIQGLTQAGKTVHAGKLTGTSCLKDLHRMVDAGAKVTLDFNDAGFASTFQASTEELDELCDTILTNLSVGDPDFVVVEIADGLVQRETEIVFDCLTRDGRIDFVGLAVHDSLAAPTCVDKLYQQWNLTPSVISGAATITPLSTSELESLVSVPCKTDHQLIAPDVLGLFRANEDAVGYALRHADRNGNGNSNGNGNGIGEYAVSASTLRESVI